MRITKTVIGKRMTVNLGNYNSVQVHCELNAEIEEGDDIKEVQDTLSKMVDEQLLKEIDQYTD